MGNRRNSRPIASATKRGRKMDSVQICVLCSDAWRTSPGTNTVLSVGNKRRYFGVSMWMPGRYKSWQHHAIYRWTQVKLQQYVSSLRKERRLVRVVPYNKG